MGWWSKTIMGGDTPLDFRDTFNGMAGIEPSYSDTPTPDSEKKVLIESIQSKFVSGHMDVILNTWGCGEPDSDYYNNQKSIGYQVLAVMLMESGAKIYDPLKVQMLEWIPKDKWAQEDEDRKHYVDNLIDALSKYDGSNTVLVKSEGLFEVLNKVYIRQPDTK